LALRLVLFTCPESFLFFILKYPYFWL
jgi:hypothetical protein